MRISHGTQIAEMSEKNGYGYATGNMIRSLRRLGYEVNQNDSTADVEIWFDQPQHWNFSKGTYKVGYHPWESTKLLSADWIDAMNECDEIWTPSPLIADWYKKFSGIRSNLPVYVYEHGVDPIWKPKKRNLDTGPFKFLHVGGEAARKGAKEAMQALRLAFPKNYDVQLDMKIISKGWKITALPRVNIINEMMGLEQLIDLFHNAHAYVYPSYGEGFGLTPLQAMATGMPTLTVPKWAPYKDFLNKDISIDSKMVKSPWPVLHPGNMLKPDMDSLIESMRYTFENYDEVHTKALESVEDLLKAYDWDTLTAAAFSGLEDRINKK